MAAVAPLLLLGLPTATIAFLAGLCLLTVVAADYASDDRALRALYDATNGDGWVRGHRGDAGVYQNGMIWYGWMNAWLNHCTWYGIACSPDGNVIMCVRLWPLLLTVVLTVAAV